MARLLFVVNNPDFFLSHRLGVGLAALASGYDVHVATPLGRGVDTIRGHGFVHHAVPLARSSARPDQELTTLVAIGRLYASTQPDIVHHVTIKPVLYGGVASRMVGVRAVVHAVSGLGYVFLARGPVAEARRRLVLAAYRLAFRHPNMRVIFQNEDDRSIFVDAGIVRRCDTVLIRGSGVDLARFQPSPEPEETFTVLLPTRMLVDKGVRETVDAARQLRGAGLVMRLLLAGPTDAGNPACIPPDEIRSWQREGLVEWLGERDDIPALMRASNVVCLPSYREGLPKALIEAAASGRAIVTTDVPGCKEVVRDGDNGLLVPMRDSVALATALASLATDPRLRARMGQSGRIRAEREFDLAAVVRDTLAIYDDIRH